MLASRHQRTVLSGVTRTDENQNIGIGGEINWNVQKMVMTGGRRGRIRASRLTGSSRRSNTRLLTHTMESKVPFKASKHCSLLSAAELWSATSILVLTISTNGIPDSNSRPER